MRIVIAAIETGGTKVVCGVVSENEPRTTIRPHRIATTTPAETIGKINTYLDDATRRDEITALGVASFGPVNVERDRERYGWVAGTPKQGWADTDLLGQIQLAGTVPTAFLSDVASAALGE